MRFALWCKQKSRMALLATAKPFAQLFNIFTKDHHHINGINRNNESQSASEDIKTKEMEQMRNHKSE